MGVITVTEKESAERCGWQHDFNSFNRMSLESANPLRSLYLGTLWHKSLDALAQKEQMTPHRFVPGGPSGLCAQCEFNVYAHMDHPARALAGFYTDSVREHYIAITGRPPLQMEMKETFQTVELVANMLTGYLKYYGGRLLPEGWKYIRTEQQFFKVIPGTNHCTCYFRSSCKCAYTQSGIRKSCRYQHGVYLHCRCSGTQCRCREDHILEGTLDGTIQHEETGKIAVLENKTFSVHPNIYELHRTSQFMGYDWIGLDFGVEEVLYNGVWTRDKVPDGWNKAENRKWNINDLYVRRVLSWDQAERANWVMQLAVTANRIFDPHYIPVRTVHPVGGCNGVNGCSYKTLCDARFHMHKDYKSILANEYRKRERHEAEPTN